MGGGELVEVLGDEGEADEIALGALDGGAWSVWERPSMCRAFAHAMPSERENGHAHERQYRAEPPTAA